MAGAFPDHRAPAACHALMQYMSSMLREAVREQRKASENVLWKEYSLTLVSAKHAQAAQDNELRPCEQHAKDERGWREAWRSALGALWSARKRRESLSERRAWYAKHLEMLHRLGPRPPRLPGR